MTGDRTHYFTEALLTIKRAKGQSGDGRAMVQVKEMEMRALQEMAVKQAVINREREKAVEKKSDRPTVPAASTPVSGDQPVPIQIKEDLVVTSFAPAAAVAKNVDPDAFWSQYRALCEQEDKASAKLGRSLQEHAMLRADRCLDANPGSRFCAHAQGIGSIFSEHIPFRSNTGLGQTSDLLRRG